MADIIFWVGCLVPVGDGPSCLGVIYFFFYLAIMTATTRELDADHPPATHRKPSAWVTELVNRADGWMDENAHFWGHNILVISALPDLGVLPNQGQIAAERQKPLFPVYMLLADKQWWKS